MDTSTSTPRRALIVTPTQGRHYSMGRMRAVFKADCAETDSLYSISEWWLEPDTTGPGTHQHPEDHIYNTVVREWGLLRSDLNRLAGIYNLRLVK